VSINGRVKAVKGGMRRLAVVLAPGLLLAGLLAGCATAPPPSDTADYQAYQEQNDPYEPTNRFFYAVNDKIDRYAFKPVAEGYIDITTVGIRNHVGNFITNIAEPGRLVNFMFEGKPRDAGTALVRFTVNSTIGIGGIFDPATKLGYQETDTDFGLTLAEWGVPAGPYLYLPVFGPSGARDVSSIPAIRRPRCGWSTPGRSISGRLTRSRPLPLTPTPHSGRFTARSVPRRCS
jgi:phospholipid-binding lipoprotein MlaA